MITRTPLKLLLPSLIAIIIGTVSAAHAQQPALRFIPLAPCRIADTRNPAGPFGGPSIAAQSSRSIPIPQSSCNVPSTAKAYSLNVTVVPKTNFLGYITVWPSDQPQPWVSMLNSTDGRVKAGAAIVPAAATGGGAISVFATDPTDIVLDINGYFVDAASHPSALAFFTLPPCRVVDTRYAGGSLGPPSMVAWNLRSFPILASSCNIPTTAQAYSLNYTAVPKFGVPIGFLSTWPTTAPDAMPVPWVSTLNVPTGAVTANAAIVPAGQNGAISVLATSGSDIVIDINGYFALSTSPSDLSFYTVPPCRVRDTRDNTGLFSTTPLPIDTSASPCAILPSAQAIVVNATVVPTPPGLGFLTLWPNGQTQPNASTLNASDGFITANMAIVPTQSAVIKAYGSQPTQLVLDTTGYFASGTDPAPETYVLTVLHSGTGTGTVTSADGRMNCGAFCAVSYVSGSSVTLTASPTGGSSFAGWSGGGCSGTGSCICGLSTATSVTAAFNPPGPPPTVTGNWNFAASSTPYPMYSSSGSGTLQQNGTTVTGQFTLYGTPCGSYVTLNGTLTGTTFTFSVMEGSQLVNFSGTINASYTYASGTYQAPSGGCTAGDYGTWTATKQ